MVGQWWQVGEGNRWVGGNGAYRALPPPPAPPGTGNGGRRRRDEETEKGGEERQACSSSSCLLSPRGGVAGIRNGTAAGKGDALGLLNLGVVAVKFPPGPFFPTMPAHA